MFNISDKVVCVDDRPDRFTKKKVLAKGAVYVVCGVKGPVSNPKYWPVGTLGLILVGVTSIDGHAWASARFRKLSEIKEENCLKANIAEAINKGLFGPR